MTWIFYRKADDMVFHSWTVKCMNICDMKISLFLLCYNYTEHHD